ncbi:TonB-dependent receptor [Dokdonella koreensis]|nr:TonB-dependent receptor [Dokdonella koreensis]
MKNEKNEQPIRRRPPALRRSLLALTLGMALGHAALAQETAGSIFGRIPDGQTGTVVIENRETGLKREIAVTGDGRFRVPGLPNGTYRVHLQRDGQVVAEAAVVVTAGAGSEVQLLAGQPTELEAYVVTASRGNAIDVSTVESPVVITTEDLKNMPIAPNLTAISLLAPGVIAGDSAYSDPPRFSALPSFGGSAVSENAYYINGYPVTNPLTNLGYSELPFNAIDQIQLSTGGYGVEYGRATGGVVNVITKRGSNAWEAGGQVIWRPEGLMAAPRNIYYGDNGRALGQPGDAGRIYQYRNENLFSSKTASAYLGGPIIKDTLFFYAAGEFVRQDGGGSDAAASSATAIENARTNGWRDYTYRTPRWLGKLDWNITGNHRLELTGFSDRAKQSVDLTGMDYTDFSHNDVKAGGYYRDDKTTTWIANYTGYLTDSLTLSGMFGRSKTDHVNEPYQYNPDCPSVTVAPGAGIEGFTYPTCQFATDTLTPAGANDKTRNGRLDLEYRVGDHTFKAGYDYNRSESLMGEEFYPGGSWWEYLRSDDPNTPVAPTFGIGSPASGGGHGLQGYYVIHHVNFGRSTLKVEQKAQYIKDLWQVTDNVLLELGLRNEQFANYNSAGDTFAKKNRQLAPRFGATWDVRGDSTLKVFANAGRYHLALPSQVAYRGADGIVNTQEAYVYTGVDPVTGAPTGLTPLGPRWSENNEFGQPKDPRTVAAANLRSHYQDAATFGFEQAISGFNVGAKASYRTLRSAIDDTCDARPFRRAALANGLDPEAVADWQFQCALFNPGYANTFYQDVDGNGVLERYDLSAADLRYDKAKRKYYAIDLFFERPFDGTWYARVDYTFSRNWGNTEGQLQSDYGQDDVSQTITWDYPELMEHANGLLPNHRKHQLKARGYYQFTPEWMLSGSFVYASGRPRNCIGYYPDPDNEGAGYGSYYYYCNGVPAPRASYGSLPAIYRFDLGVRYAPGWAKGMTFSADVFNLFNRQSAQNVVENRFLNTSSSTVSANWDRVRSYSPPRYIQFSARYDW